jgi:hypothetical protein
LVICISIRGYAAVTRRDGEPVTDPAVLRALDGLAYDAELTDYFDSSPVEVALAAALEPGGGIVFTHRGSDQCLTATTEYHSARQLTPDELGALVDHTVAHWFNGVGRTLWLEEPIHHEYDIRCLWSREAVASHCPSVVVGSEYPIVEMVEE